MSQHECLRCPVFPAVSPYSVLSCSVLRPSPVATFTCFKISFGPEAMLNLIIGLTVYSIHKLQSYMAINVSGRAAETRQVQVYISFPTQLNTIDINTMDPPLGIISWSPCRSDPYRAKMEYYQLSHHKIDVDLKIKPGTPSLKQTNPRIKNQGKAWQYSQMSKFLYPQLQ